MIPASLGSKAYMTISPRPSQGAGRAFALSGSDRGLDDQGDPQDDQQGRHERKLPADDAADPGGEGDEAHATPKPLALMPRTRRAALSPSRIKSRSGQPRALRE